MSAATASAPVKHEKAIEPAVQAITVAEPAAIPVTQPGEPALRRDWLTLLVWLGGAAILILLQIINLLEWLFRR